MSYWRPYKRVHVVILSGRRPLKFDWDLKTGRSMVEGGTSLAAGLDVQHLQLALLPLQLPRQGTANAARSGACIVQMLWHCHACGLGPAGPTLDGREPTSETFGWRILWRHGRSGD